MINVNTITSHLSSKGVPDELAPLVQQLAKRADTNKDGQVSSTEFTDFLQKLMQSIDASQQSSTTNSAADTGARASALVAGSAHVPLPVTTSQSGAASMRAMVASLSKER